MPLDKAQIARAFGRAAAHYDANAILQKSVGEQLLERLDFVKLQPERVLDLGSGTGLCAGKLASRYPRADMVLLDIATGMLLHARKQRRFWRKTWRFVCADAEALPIETNTFDIVFSNLSLQWLIPIDAALAECQRILKPGGLLLFSTLGPETLYELRAATADLGGGKRVSRFTDILGVGNALNQAGFYDPVLDTDRVVVNYSSPMALMRDLKIIGAGNALSERPRGLLGRKSLAKITAAYEEFRVDTQYPATYEVIYAHAWANTASVHGQTTDRNEHRIPVSAIGRRQ